MNDDARSVDGIVQGWWAYHEMGDDRGARVRRERPTEPEDTAAVDAWMVVVLDESLDAGAQRVLRPWMPHLHDGAVRPPARPRPRGRRWKDRDGGA